MSQIEEVPTDSTILAVDGNDFHDVASWLPTNPTAAPSLPTTPQPSIAVTATTAVCDVGELQSQGSKEDVMITTQVNSIGNQVFVAAVGPNVVADSNSSNDRSEQEVVVTPVVEDAITISLASVVTVLASVPIINVPVVISANFGNGISGSVVVTGTTDSSGSFNGNLSQLDFDSIEATISLTETSQVSDFDTCNGASPPTLS